MCWNICPSPQMAFLHLYIFSHVAKFFHDGPDALWPRTPLRLPTRADPSSLSLAWAVFKWPMQLLSILSGQGVRCRDWQCHFVNQQFIPALKVAPAVPPLCIQSTVWASRFQGHVLFCVRMLIYISTSLFYDEEPLERRDCIIIIVFFFSHICCCCYSF